MHDKRRSQLKQWVGHKLRLSDLELVSLTGDASFRRYFRLQLENISLIAVDSPPEKEDNDAFIAVCKTFAAQGIHVPTVLHYNEDLGFLILTDLGDELYLNCLHQDNCDRLYQDAIDSLIKIQRCTDFHDWHLPKYDGRLFDLENSLFDHWFLEKHLNLTISNTEKALLDNIYQLLKDNAFEQPQVCVHRDYHSRNLMRSKVNNPAVIDFQSAVLGPITYDLASLFRDCYINWPEEKVKQWCTYYQEQAVEHQLLTPKDTKQFQRWFDLMGLQRNLKTIGIFARLSIRDGKHQYLGDIPRTLNYAISLCKQYPELASFGAFINDRIETQLCAEAVG